MKAKHALVGGGLLFGLALIAFAVAAPDPMPEKTATPDRPMKETPRPPSTLPDPDGLTEAEWRALLTPEQHRILREAGTERPFGEVYEQFKSQGEGSYYCAGCGTLLFSSAHKFDSHCGWPSFYDPAKIESVKLREDSSHGMVRTEVVCANCEGHLGHLFKGEGFDTPTDQRFCINGYVLVFVPDGEEGRSEK